MEPRPIVRVISRYGSKWTSVAQVGLAQRNPTGYRPLPGWKCRITLR